MGVELSFAHNLGWGGGLVDALNCWCARIALILNTNKNMEMVIDFSRSKPPLKQVSNRGMGITGEQSYRQLGGYLDRKLDWPANTDAVYKKGLTRLFLL